MTTLAGQEFTDHMDTLSGLLRPLRLLPVDDLLQAVGAAEALAPVVDPTGYRDRGANNLRDQRRVLEAVRQLQTVMDDIAGPIAGGQL